MFENKLGYLEQFLTENVGKRMEVETKYIGGIVNGVIRFTGVSHHIDEPFEDGSEDWGWVFYDVVGWRFSVLPVYFKDIARVRLVGDMDWAWVAEREFRELELA